VNRLRPREERGKRKRGDRTAGPTIRDFHVQASLQSPSHESSFAISLPLDMPLERYGPRPMSPRSRGTNALWGALAVMTVDENEGAGSSLRRRVASLREDGPT
jgi:hypothetical protein